MPPSLRSALRTLVAPSAREDFRAWRCRLLWRWLVHRGGGTFDATSAPALVVAPHPDDETLGCGGLIALKRARGVEVRVVFLTDGRRSHEGDTASTPDDLAATRRGEAGEALGALGVLPEHTLFLDYPDHGLAALSDPVREELRDRLANLISTHRPGEVYVTHCGDGHPDHEAACALVRAALARADARADLLLYPIWLLWWRNWPFLDLKPREVAGARSLPIGPVASQKKKALDSYRSQGLILTDGFLQRFLTPYELFFPDRSVEQGGDGPVSVTDSP